MRRRSLLLGGLGTASTAALAALAQPSAADQPANAKSKAAADFDFDTGNFIRDLLSKPPEGEGAPLEQAIGPMDASVIIWVSAVTQVAWYDALAPYHPTAVGVHSRIGRRPASESATNRNKNIAGLYATYQAVKIVYAERLSVIRKLMTDVGLNPDDDSTDPTTPVGIGNLAGQAVVKAHLRDGMNFLGDEGGRKYNPRPFADYTGFKPVNNAYELKNPSLWQPDLGPHRRRVGGGPGDKGIFIVQHFVTAHFERVKAYTYRDPSQFKIAPPDHTDHTNPRRYKASVDEVLAASAGLTDEQKAKTEFFDNKFLGITQSVLHAAEAHKLDLDGWVQLHFTTAVALFDDLIACWHQKRKYESVRPFSAIRHVYGDRKVTAWGGPGKGKVDDIPASEWTSYIPVGDHPDYPSGSTTLCGAEAQAARRFLGDDVLNWTYTFPAGSTLTEPGLVPAKDVKLHYPTWTAFEKDCAISRVWAGVHFRTTVERSLVFGKPFGDRAYEFAQRHIKGEV